MTSHGSRRDRGREGWDAEGRGSILFIFVTLLALAALPVTVSLRLASIDAQVREVLDPARDLAADLSVNHARQMARYQEFLLTGDREAERRYRDLIRVEDEVRGELRELLQRADPELQRLGLRVGDALATWQLDHVMAFTEVGRAQYREGEPLSADLAKYDALLTASLELRDGLNARTELARQRIQGVRDLQLIVTIALVALALTGTFVVGRLSGRLRTLVRDVSERHRETLRVRRELDAVFDATADAVLDVDSQGRVRRLNSAGTRLLGWSEEDARGEPLSRVLFGRVREAEGDHSPVMRAVTEGRSVDSADAEVRRRGSGEMTPVLWSARPLGREGGDGGAVVTLTDVTEIRAATRALERSIQAREETLAVVSHDLRSPLSSVQAGAELLLEVPLSEEKREMQLTSMLRASERMERLIQDLLDLARIDQGGLSVQRERLDAAAVVREAVDLLRTRAEAAGIDLTCEVEAGGVQIEADRDRLLQVFENLVSNALRHTDQGGTISVGAEATDAGVCFSVRDTGVGIPSDQIEHLFDRFWRPEMGRREGAGLGLSIVRGIVEAHGGRVTVTSEPGVGSAFAFTIPASD